MNRNLNGLVLCGGKSSRMGRDKSLIQYHGKPQRDYLTGLLRLFCDQVFISGPKNLKTTDSFISDHFDLESPLNGILSAFHFDPDSAWLTMPVDMPNIDSAAIEFLLRHRDTGKIATCFLDSDGQPEPLFVIWEAKARPVLFDFFNQGGISPRKFLMENDVHLLGTPMNSWLVNINTEEELTSFLNQPCKNLQGSE